MFVVLLKYIPLLSCAFLFLYLAQDVDDILGSDITSWISQLTWLLLWR